MNKSLSPKQRRVVEELLKRNISQADLYKAEQAPPRLGFLRELTPLQKEIYEDPSRFKALVLGRRSGKTFYFVSQLLATAEKKPGCTVAFIGFNIKKARALIWEPLQQFNRNYSLGISFNNNYHIATFPNGSKIWVTGCNTKKDAENIRGAGLSGVCLDEAGSDYWSDYLQYIIEDAIEPALFENKGYLYLAGTPNASCTGYFYDITTSNKGFKVWYGSLLDNTKLFSDINITDPQETKKLAIQELAALRKRRGWSESTPKYRREYFAEWVRETSDSVIDFEQTRNTFDNLPNVPFNYLLGIDTGVKDATALVVVAYSRYNPNMYIVETETGNGWSYDETVAKIRLLDKQYEFDMMVCDPAAAGALFVQDIADQYDLPIEAAKKREKAAFLQQLSSEFRCGRVKIHSSLTKTIQDFKKLQWKNDHRREIIGAERHELDALRYAFVEILGCRGKEEYSPAAANFNDKDEQKLVEEYQNEMMDDLELEDLCSDLY